MKTCHITVRDEVFCHITGLEPQDQTFLENKFAVLMEGAYWHPKVRLGVWNGKIAFFDKTGKIYHRLLPDVLPYLETWRYDIKLNDLRPPVPSIDTRVDKDWFSNKPGMELRVELRPYQVAAVNACLDATSGFIEMATASGKTLVIAAVADVLARHGLRTVVIVPSDDLVQQTVATFRLCLLDVGVYSGSKKDIYHEVVVATWQAMQNNPSLMNEFQTLIVDECVHPDTLIETVNGSIPIKNIVIGHQVLTFNEHTGKKEFKRVKKVHSNLLVSLKEKRLRIKLENGNELIITGNHKVLTTTGWKRADTLTKNDELI